MEGQRPAETITLGFDYNIFSCAYEFLLVKHTPEGTFHGKIDWGKPLKDINGIRVRHRTDPEFKPTFTVYVEERDRKPKFFSEFIRDLKHVNIIEKPIESDFLKGELKAKDEHLQDMRRLTFDDTVVIGHEPREVNVKVSKN